MVSFEDTISRYKGWWQSRALCVRGGWPLGDFSLNTGLELLTALGLCSFINFCGEMEWEYIRIGLGSGWIYF